MKKMCFAIAMLLIMFIPQFAQAEGDQFIIINKSINELAFYENGELVRTFPVATGKTNSLTPEGVFPIVNKIKNRPYYTNGIPGGDARNPLGDRWLGLNARGTYGTTYAIHGNNNSNSIGKYVSAGCVRMRNDDIHWLFDRVKVHTNVLIVNSSKSFAEIVSTTDYQLKPPIKVIIDGKELAVNVHPFMDNNRVLVPMRSIFDEIGATVQWDSATKSITAIKNNHKIQLKINSKQATIDGQPQVLDVAPTIRQNTTFVPTRFVSEALGVAVQWDSKKSLITLTSPKEPTEQERTKISVTVNGQEVIGGGFIEAGTAMVPLRDIFTPLGASLQYNPTTSTLTVIYGGNKMTVASGDRKAIINGEIISLPQASVIVDGRLYVPARALTEGFAGEIIQDQKTNKVIIVLSKR
ncbi:L,D-transpeptidase family protein [Peribacillus loiseleuriae]|uniref:L,D-transpeptidase family protein n=1 Tax=Peribacillus loiseleuriae TaxID=1679170 RepID=UPI0009E477DE|nr:stalk domain-containing protein [Peribacillus loiseleuriae]